MSDSLHTKHRPPSFDQIIGQDVVVASLKHVVQDKRAHAFIFTGPPGTGKTTLGRILANEFADGKATAGNIEEIDAASNSGAEAMRLLTGRVHFRAVGASPVKTIIVDEAHRLSSAAWTVLLKPIEEPPRHVYWVLCSTEPSKIPKAIQTRCLKYDLKPVSEDLLLGLLDKVCQAEGLEVADEVLEIIIEGAQGSPRQALVGLEACLHATTSAQARELMRSAGQSREAVDLARFLLKRQGRSWGEAMKLLKALEGQDAEGIRIVILAYLTSVLMNTRGEQQAMPLLGLLECFRQPYQQSDRFAPLLMSIGMALEMDR